MSKPLCGRCLTPTDGTGVALLFAYLDRAWVAMRCPACKADCCFGDSSDIPAPNLTSEVQHLWRSPADVPKLAELKAAAAAAGPERRRQIEKDARLWIIDAMDRGRQYAF